MNIGDKVKTRLEQPEIMCSFRDKVEFYHWWKIVKIDNEIYTLEDKNGNYILIDIDGYDEQDNKYIIYKVKKGE